VEHRAGSGRPDPHAGVAARAVQKAFEVVVAARQQLVGASVGEVAGGFRRGDQHVLQEFREAERALVVLLVLRQQGFRAGQIHQRGHDLLPARRSEELGCPGGPRGPRVHQPLEQRGPRPSGHAVPQACQRRIRSAGQRPYVETDVSEVLLDVLLLHYRHANAQRATTPE
jgi:hypothetical protein